MRVLVQLFGGFHATGDGIPVANMGRTERRILARLCLSEPGMSRRALAESLWPGLDFATAGNRLRTGLVGLRRSFKGLDPFLADRWHLALNPGRVSCDLWLAVHADRTARRAFEPGERQAALKSLVEATSLDLLPLWEDDWAVAARESWRTTHVDACLSLAEQSSLASDWPSASEWASAAVDRDPTSTPAWTELFRAMSSLGRGPEAARKFFAARKAHGLSGEAWADLESAAKTVRRIGPATGPGMLLDMKQTEFLRRAFGKMVWSDPAAAARFLSHPVCGQQIDHEPAWMLQVIDHLVEATQTMPEEALARVAALRAYALLGERASVREHSQWILENDTDDSRRLGTLQVMTFHETLDGEWDLALAHQNEAIEIARRLGDGTRLHKGRGQLGHILWHMGRGAEALAVAKDAYAGLDAAGSASPDPALVRMACNVAMILATQGDEADAEAWLNRSRSHAATAGATGFGAVLDPIAGYVATVQGQFAIGSKLTVQGITSCMRRSDRRNLELAFDFGSATLALMGQHARAQALLALGEKLRSMDGRSRTRGEEAFANRVRSRADTTPDPEWLLLQTPAAMAKAAIAALEEAVPSRLSD